MLASSSWIWAAWNSRENLTRLVPDWLCFLVCLGHDHRFHLQDFHPRLVRWRWFFLIGMLVTLVVAFWNGVWCASYPPRLDLATSYSGQSDFRPLHFTEFYCFENHPFHFLPCSVNWGRNLMALSDPCNSPGIYRQIGVSYCPKTAGLPIHFCAVTYPGRRWRPVLMMEGI